MAKLVYSSLASLDSYDADEAGMFDWAVPDAEVLDFINRFEQGVGTNLYGRTPSSTARQRSRPSRSKRQHASATAFPVLGPPGL